MTLRHAARTAAFSVAFAILPTAWADAPAPVAPVRNAPETFFGTTVDDPYRYFEDAKAPEVAAWM